MTDLKPCPKQYSLSELQMHPYQTAMQMVHERALEIAEHTRPVPELPEGYRERGGTLFKGEVRIAILYPSGDLSLRSRNLDNEDAHALAIFLQRMGK